MWKKVEDKLLGKLLPGGGNARQAITPIFVPHSLSCLLTSWDITYLSAGDLLNAGMKLCSVTAASTHNPGSMSQRGRSVLKVESEGQQESTWGSTVVAPITARSHIGCVVA